MIEEWIAAVVARGGERAAALASGRELGECYGQGHRRYHTARHVDAVLAHAAELADELGLGAEDRDQLVLAVCGHDVVYDARPGEDERASADWVQARLGAAGLAEPLPGRVAELIGYTATHTAAPADVVAGVLLDADLAILATAPARYADYVAAVRQEYAAVPEPQWRIGRAQVLRGLLAREALFVTAPGARRWEAAARANVTAELAGYQPA